MRCITKLRNRTVNCREYGPETNGSDEMPDLRSARLCAASA